MELWLLILATVFMLMLISDDKEKAVSYTVAYCLTLATFVAYEIIKFFM